MVSGKILQKIASYFVEFGNAKDLPGGKWESLFNIVLLIRCLIGEFHEHSAAFGRRL